ALDVDFEMYGKDHSTNTGIYDRICEILGGRKPDHFIYELFLDDEGRKISKTSGNGISMDEWLTYAASESLSYFMFQKPQTAKRLFFDVIPKAVDEYHQQLRTFEGQDAKAKLANPVYHIHRGQPPVSTLLVPFSMLLNLASVASTDDPDQLWGFLKRYAPSTSPETHPDLARAVQFALRYYTDFVKPHRQFRAPTELEREALEDLRARLVSYSGPLEDEALQSIVYACGRDRFEPLRDWFKALYEVLLGASQGPRFGGFIALYGVEETISLIDAGLTGTLARN
ncbi:MAG: lysine--tRNA ligase, partial [Pseudomonadota bacterium]